MSVPASEVIFTHEATGGVGRPLSDKLSEPFFASVSDFDTLADACAASDIVNVPNVSGSDTDITNPSVMDAYFHGDGTTTLTRKNVFPELTPADDYAEVDISAPIHLKQFNTAAAPVVVLIGDSLSTYFANSIARSDMLAEVLRTTIQEQVNAVQFYDRSISGTSYPSFLGNNYNASISWYTNPSWGWYQYIQALAPDLVILAWGMNDNSSIKMQAISQVVAWLNNTANLPKTPSIIFATNLVPNPSQPASLDGMAGKRARAKWGGAVRTFAKYYGYGVLVFHRKVCRVRDGYDPVSSAIGNTQTSVAAMNNGVQTITGVQRSTDWKIRLQFNASGLSSSNVITLMTGSGGNDFMTIAQPAPGQLQFTLSTGALDQLIYANQTVNYSLPSGTGYYLTIERSNNGLVVYEDLDGNSGGYNGPIFASKLIALGGDYLQVITNTSGNLLMQADISYGSQRLNKPSIKNSVLWGNGAQPIGEYGGSGYNHCSGWMATHVYRPVARSVRWSSPRFPQGTVLVSAGSTSVTVTLLQNETNVNYWVNVCAIGGQLPQNYLFSRSINSFTINFTSPLASATYLGWQLIRP